LAFSAARTYHHLAVTIEQAGFEIRDQIMWIYSSGFPKSQDIGKSIQRSMGVKKTKPLKEVKSFGATTAIGDYSDPGFSNVDTICTDPEALQWQGWGTALKPAHEPICLARKPIKLSIAGNCQAWGVGALNIDATRVPYADEADLKLVVDWANKYTSPGVQEYSKLDGSVERTHTEEQFKSEASQIGRFPSNVIGDIPNYQKYFYCPKVGRRERHVGFDTTKIPQIGSTHPDDVKRHPLWEPYMGGSVEHLKEKIRKLQIPTEQSMLDAMGGYYCDNAGNKQELSGKNIWLPQTGQIYVHGLKEEYRKWCESNGITLNAGNNHPTVKPIELMKYLIKLITPAGGHVLDPFNGSGSTGCAAVELDYDYTGIELDEKYVDIARKRIEAWHEATHATTYSELFTCD
jgi:site-specific DNA-methyltransferase (adenine-specific)